MTDHILQNDQAIHLYTDGSCLDNPGAGGWAVVILAGADNKTLTGSDPSTTNNRMEIQAVIEGLRLVHDDLDLRSQSQNQGLIVFTDSQYVQKGIQEWSPTWLKRNWRTASGKPVKNQDLWHQLIDITNKTNPQWNWVKGHAGNTWNEHVDEAARNAALAARPLA